jgi:polysaccharide biosynthesis transport protein
VAQELNLRSRAEFNPNLPAQGLTGKLARMAGLSSSRPSGSEEEAVLQAYYRALQVFQVKDTRVITIEFTTTDSELSARAANRLAERYQDWLRSQSVVQTADASEWLKPQIDKLQGEVAEAESEVERFRSQANLFRGAAQGSLNEQQLSDLTAEVSRTRAVRSEAEARARAARELLQRNSAEAIPEVQKSPIIQALIAQRVRAEREKAEAETSLLSGHPRMKQLNANVADLKRAVNKEAVAVVEGLEKEARTIAVREELAVKSLDEMKARVGNKADDIAKLASLEGQAKAKRRELEGLQASFEATRSRGDAKAVPMDATLLSSARPSSVPTSPKKAQLALLASGASLILGFALVITRELISGARRDGNATGAFAAEPSLGARGRAGRRATDPPAAPIGAEPRADVEPEPAPRPSVARAMGPARALPAAPEATADETSLATTSTIADVAQRVLGKAQDQGGFRTIVAGEASGMSIAQEAVALTDALTGSGKQVVLVDWCPDGKGLAETLELDRVPGFTDLLQGRASFEEVIRRLPGSEAHLVPCGSAIPGGIGAPDADRLNLVLDALDEAYDHVVVVGDHKAIRDLFLTVEGRFDAAVVVAERRSRTAGNAISPGQFLGFQVTDIELIRFDRGGAETRKLQLARSTMRLEARA